MTSSSGPRTTRKTTPVPHWKFGGPDFRRFDGGSRNARCQWLKTLTSGLTFGIYSNKGRMGKQLLSNGNLWSLTFSLNKFFFDPETCGGIGIDMQGNKNSREVFHPQLRTSPFVTSTSLAFASSWTKRFSSTVSWYRKEGTDIPGP